MTIDVVRLDPAGYQQMPWKNGGGMGINIADAPVAGNTAEGWDSLLWRFGRTAILTPGPFSYLPGVDRVQMVVQGCGLVLKSAEQEFDERQAFTSVRFAGELDIVTELEAGPVEVVNLMGNRAAADVDLTAITEPSSRLLPAGLHIIYAATGDSVISMDDQAYNLIDQSSLKVSLSSPATLILMSGLVVIATIVVK